jgi:TIR domain.
MKNELTIFSYSRIDSEFVLKLAKDLRNSHANIWLDQLDIEPGSHWDQAIENAMKASKCVIVVLSPNSINSYNVMDEVSYAIEEGKRVVPILFKDCSIPLRIRRLQYIDFRINYALSFDQLIKSLHLEEEILPEPGKTDSEIKQNEVEPLHKAEEEERQRLDQIKAEVQRKAKEEKEKLKQIKAEAQHKAEDEKEKLKQLKAEDHRKTEEEKKKRAVESESLLNQPSTGSENGPPETILIKISKIIRKKPIILYIGILSLLIIILAGYFIFKPKHPIPGPFGTIPEPSKYDTLATITNLVDQKKT